MNKDDYRIYCEAKRDIGEEPLSLKQHAEFTRLVADAYTVILERGAKGERAYLHADRQSAMRRAHALAVLHSCAMSSEGNVIRVNASGYYGSTKP